jgi:hypothetical protein
MFTTKFTKKPGGRKPSLVRTFAEGGLASDDYTTKLEPDDEKKFQVWKRKNAPKDSGADYDLRGAFKSGLAKDPETGHWNDKFKKPNHPTFSDESQYAKGEQAERAGHWVGETFVPPANK